MIGRTGIGLSGSTTHAASDTLQLDDNIQLQFGTDSDIVMLNRSTSLAANEEVTDVIEGTSIHQGVAANSLILSNITNNGDIMMLASGVGNSLEFLNVDSDDGIGNAQLTLGWGMDTFEIGLVGSSRLKYTPGAWAFQEATTFSTTTGDLTIRGGQNIRLQVATVLADDTRMAFGNNADGVLAHRTNGLSADEELAAVILGTSVHQGTSNNSFIFSNITTDADILMLVNDGGDSLEFLLANADVADLQLGHGMATVTVKTASGDLTLNPGGNVVLGNDALIQRDVNAGLTASTTQTQGQGALTAEINEIATVAFADDTITLPTAVAGLSVRIINNGANQVQIFPASGDNLGAGADTAESLASGSNKTYTAYDATNWEDV